jgi:hypothetical protein
METESIPKAEEQPETQNQKAGCTVLSVLIVLCLLVFVVVYDLWPVLNSSQFEARIANAVSVGDNWTEAGPRITKIPGALAQVHSGDRVHIRTRRLSLLSNYYMQLQHRYKLPRPPASLAPVVGVVRLDPSTSSVVEVMILRMM